MNFYQNDLHVEYMDVTRHWCPYSEKFAGCDALLTRLYTGWIPSGQVYFAEHWLAGVRPVTVYHFELTRNGETLEMPVMSNPYTRRVLRQLNATILPIEERDAARKRERRS